LAIRRQLCGAGPLSVIASSAKSLADADYYPNAGKAALIGFCGILGLQLTGLSLN
jgi:hypothetical protein